MKNDFCRKILKKTSLAFFGLAIFFCDQVLRKFHFLHPKFEILAMTHLLPRQHFCSGASINCFRISLSDAATAFVACASAFSEVFEGSISIRNAASADKNLNAVRCDQVKKRFWCESIFCPHGTSQQSHAMELGPVNHSCKALDCFEDLRGLLDIICPQHTHWHKFHSGAC